MILLNTIAAPNSLQAHGLNHVAIYADPTVSLYKKNEATNDLTLLKTYTLAGVKRLALSDNGQILSAQTATQTHRLSVAGASPYDVVGQLAVADRNYTVVLTPTAVQVIRETVVNMTATLGVADRVVCGAKTFMVYSRSRYILGSYTAGLQAPVTPANPIVHVAHTGGDKFAIFYANGSVELNGKTRPLLSLAGHRDSGWHVVANDGTFEYAYMRKYPLTDPVKIRPYVPPPVMPELIYDEAYARADSFINPEFSFTDDYYALPQIPLKVIDRDLVAQPVTTPADVKYATMQFVESPFASIMAVGSLGYTTNNRGQRWDTMGGAASQYRTGFALRHKGFNYIWNDTALNFRKVASGLTGGSTVTSNIGNKAVNLSGYIAKSANAVIISQATATTPNLFYVGWDYPATISSYTHAGIAPNTRFVYLGSNLFVGFNSTNGAVFIYIGPTSGSIAVFGTIADLTQMAHLNGTLVFCLKTANNTIQAAPLEVRPDDSQATLATTTTYFNQIKAAMAQKSQLFTLPANIAYFGAWKPDRLVVGDLKRVRIWQF